MAAYTDKDIMYIKALTGKKKTIYELAEEFDVHTNTVQRQLDILIAKGVVKEYPIRKGKRKQYIAVAEQNPDGSFKKLRVLPIILSNGDTLELAYSIKLLATTEKANVQTNIVAKIVYANLFRELFPNELFGTFEEYKLLAEEQLFFIRARLEMLEELVTREELWDERIVEELSNWQETITEEELRDTALRVQATLVEDVPVAKKRWEKQLNNPPSVE